MSDNGDPKGTSWWARLKEIIGARHAAVLVALAIAAMGAAVGAAFFLGSLDMNVRTVRIEVGELKEDIKSVKNQVNDIDVTIHENTTKLDNHTALLESMGKDVAINQKLLFRMEGDLEVIRARAQQIRFETLFAPLDRTPPLNSE